MHNSIINNLGFGLGEGRIEDDFPSWCMYHIRKGNREELIADGRTLVLEVKVRGMEKHPGRVLLVYNWTKYYVGCYDPGINNLLKKSSQRMNSSSMKECPEWSDYFIFQRYKILQCMIEVS